MKRITILSREILERGKKGYFKNKKEYEIFIDYTDNKINKELEELNKNKRSRFFEIEQDFNLKTQKGKKDFLIYLINNTNTLMSLPFYKKEVYEIHKKLTDILMNI